MKPKDLNMVFKTPYELALPTSLTSALLSFCLLR